MEDLKESPSPENAETIDFQSEDSKIDIEEISENKNSLESETDTPSESVEINTETTNTTNCLALTIQEDHKSIAIKNVFLRSIRMSWKVVVSTITLALIKLFS